MRLNTTGFHPRFHLRLLKKRRINFSDNPIVRNNLSTWHIPVEDNAADWLPNTEKEFYIKTQGIEDIYLNYTPEYIFLEINLKAGDPIGFSYYKNIAEYNLKNKWKKIKR